MDLPPDMTDLYHTYEQDLLTHLDALRQVERLTADDTAERTAAEGTARRAEEALQQLEMEVRTLPPASKETLRPKVREYKTTLTAIRKKLRALAEEGQRSALFNNQTRRDMEMHEMEQKMERGERVLSGARDEALRTETIGQEIMGDLHRQREVLQRTKGHLGTLGDELATSNQMVDDIMGVYKKNSSIVNVICAMIIISTLFVVFIRSSG